MRLARHEQVWNRAYEEACGATLNMGDAALASLLRVQNLILNSGVEHALECLTDGEYTAAIAAYRYFGLEPAALALERARQPPEPEPGELDELYRRAVPVGKVITTAFKSKFVADPGAFADIEGDSHA